jgi:hypothetical protein
MQQKTKVKKRTNQTIVLETQSDEMLRSGTGLLFLSVEKTLRNTKTIQGKFISFMVCVTLVFLVKFNVE